MTKEDHIQEAIQMIKFHAAYCSDLADIILNNSDDYFSKHYANQIKPKQDDILKMLGAIEQLLKEK